MLKAATVSPLRGETMSRGATGVTGSVTSASFSETVTSTTDCTGSAGSSGLTSGTSGVTGSAVMGVVTGGSVTLVGVLSAEEGSSIQ